MKGSIIIPCLNSHEIVRRQLLWFDSWMKPFDSEWNLIIVDDGSSPSLEGTTYNFNTYIIHIPEHAQKWPQPHARNMGARHARDAEYLFFTDIDHIITPETLGEANRFKGDKLQFTRKTGFLDKYGILHSSKEDLLTFGTNEFVPRHRIHQATCSIRKIIHESIGGFNESFCGTHGPDDIEYAKRYNNHVQLGFYKPSELAKNTLYVFPDPAKNSQKLFHSLER